MITSLQKRGAPPQLLQSLTGVYQQLTRTYRLHGSFSQWWKVSNGIIQGCSLSLIGLNSLICCILEEAYNLPTPQLNESPISRAYADDVSADCAAKTPSRLVNKLKDFHAIVQKYETCGIGEINKKKTFTFGHHSLQGAIEPSFEHQNDIRMVGVSIVTDHPCDSFTELEQSRFRKWGDTIIKIRRLPISWKDKTRTLLSTQSQATFGQGAHQMCKDLSLLKKLRTSIMCCLLQADFYSMSPLVTLSVLAPVHLDPHFALIYYVLQSLQRFFKSDPSVLVKIKQILTRPRSSTIGPAARLADLLHSPVKSQVQQLLDNNITNVDKWKHDMREAWRQHMFSQLEHDRPQHYIPISLKSIDDELSSIIQNLNPLQMDLSMLSSIQKTLICSSLCCVVSLLEAWWPKNEIKGIADNITSKTVNVALKKLRPSNMFHGLVSTISIFVIPSSKCSKSVSINSQLLRGMLQSFYRIAHWQMMKFFYCSKCLYKSGNNIFDVSTQKT